jgi:hypothetical protein
MKIKTTNKKVLKRENKPKTEPESEKKEPVKLKKF